jgi:hypothetical protein
MLKQMTSKQFILPAILIAGFLQMCGSGQGMAKSQVGNLIKQVEDGTDILATIWKACENAKDSPAASSGQTQRGRHGNGRSKNNAKSKERCAWRVPGDLNKSTNKLRRKFDGTDAWISTKNEVESVVEDGRKVNQSLTKEAAMEPKRQGFGAC